MRGSRRILALMAALLVTAACADLNVENLNDPDRERALATPGDVETLISGTFRRWWITATDIGNTPSDAMSVMSDQHTSSWGNAMMKDSSQEPRVWAINNDPAYGYSYVVEEPWYDSYTILASVRDGILSIEGGVDIGDGGDDNHRAIAFARFMQGMAHMTVALLYDEAFILDETTDLSVEQVRVPYSEVQTAALGYFNEALTMIAQESFNVPGSWTCQTDFTSAELGQVIHSFMAKLLAYTPRTVAERNAVTWTGPGSVQDHASQGITADVSCIMDDDVYWSDHAWVTQWPSWARTDLRMLGPADQSGAYQAWEAQTPGLRTPFMIDADDLRFPIYPPVEVADDWDCVGLPRDNSCGGPALRHVMEYRDPDSPFRPERGTYHFSGYAAFPEYNYFTTWTGPVPLLLKEEMDMLQAEAYLRDGPAASAWPLIDATRVTYGGLTSVDGLATGDPVLEDAPGRCTPRTAAGACGSLLEAMKYEKRLETFGTGMNYSWLDDRGWGDLVSGTITMFPVPAQELLTLLEEVYTFGGDPGSAGSAPDVVSWDEGGLRPLNPGDEPSEADIRARVDYFNRLLADERPTRPTTLQRR
jgi:hypothetical protein